MILASLKLRHWPFAAKLTLSPALALCGMVAIAWVGAVNLAETVRSVNSLQRNGEAGRQLSHASQGVQDINGTLYRVLALQAAHSPSLDAAAELDRLLTSINCVSGELRDWRGSHATEAQRPRLDTLIGSVENYRTAVAWVRQMLDVDFASAVSFLQPFDSIYIALTTELAAMVQDVARSDSQSAASAYLAATDMRYAFKIVAVLVLVAVVTATAFLAVATIRSIRAIARATLALAGGELSVDLAALARRDELGAIVRSLGVFRDGLAHVAGLGVERAQQKRDVENARKAELLKIANAFEDTVGTIVRVVAAASTGMQSNARAMSGAATLANDYAAGSEAAARVTTKGLHAVAGAADSLTTSIDEISRHVSQSALNAELAAADARRTDGIVRALADDSQRIGEVVQLINSIAGQTKMLALNAAMEAARAGTAGDGFAVVAAEVKSLAMQTAQATDVIARQIGHIQTGTRQAVTAIGGVASTVEKMSSIAAFIARAMEQQGSATAEINHTVQQLAASTHELLSNTTDVSHAANDTGIAADQLLGSAEQLAGQAELLDDQVVVFLANVRNT